MWRIASKSGTAPATSLVVVVSAMSGETDRLINLAKKVQPSPDARELDVVASTGEQVTVGLLAMALLERGLKAKSYTGAQVHVLTDSAFNKARILSIDEKKIRDDLDSGTIVVVAGFQGVDERGNITTLGRGGSDTSAVALAAALKADECLIYTDVDGVYTTDPRIVPEARRMPRITFEEMLEMASLGLEGAAAAVGRICGQVQGAAARAVEHDRFGHAAGRRSRVRHADYVRGRHDRWKKPLSQASRSRATKRRSR